MPSKKVTISQKIFIFLLITVGIVFLLLQVYRSVREGFDNDIRCKILDLGASVSENGGEPAGRKTYVCETRDEALNQLMNMRDDSFNNYAVCYTDIVITSNTISNGNFAIGGSNISTTFYTCFDRPPRLEFDTTTGTKLPIADMDDQQPLTGVNTLQANCSAYNGAFQTYFNSYIKTSSILGSVNTIGYSNIASSINVLSTVSSQKCKSGNPGTNTAVKICDSINDGITRFINISNDTTSPNSLSNLKSVLIESKNVLSNQMYMILKPAFLNSGCIADADMEKYFKVI
jgi:hypothetical protein